MKRIDLVLRVRSYTRDLSNSIFRSIDVTDYLNEGIDRMKEVVPEFSNMIYLVTDTDIPILLPTQHHHLLSVYAASRCFSQDERHFQATNLMNEFENKLGELHDYILQGIVLIKDAAGLTIVPTLIVDNVQDVYSSKKDYTQMKNYFPPG